MKYFFEKVFVIRFDSSKLFFGTGNVMKKYFLKRFLLIIPTLLGMTFIVF
ncbi:hypothetical protein LEP1GSC188_3687 [Leptospira weilii serovar Topaz str. LT2116]|uniref:Uncharacterized protein n=1 Tax=Leptospira weilii serovar Topaz str. LT2116 TaxID=1088540 RepID=M3GUS2_9LEPT|nr:hypothetical protein LEP1GSC188_3687 [Leptospira weilii serovar Topaz str. LT2116]